MSIKHKYTEQLSGQIRLQRMTVDAMKSFAVDDELWDWVAVHVVLSHTPSDLLVLHQRQEHVDELQAVGGCDGLQDLRHEISEIKMINGGEVDGEGRQTNLINEMSVSELCQHLTMYFTTGRTQPRDRRFTSLSTNIFLISKIARISISP